MSSIDPDLLYGATSDLLGFVADTENAALMLTNGTDAAVLGPKIQSVKDALQKSRNDRDKTRAVYQIDQRAFEKTAADNYHVFSNLVDTISGAVGKETPLGKQVLAYRKHVTGSDKHHQATPPTTTPTNPPAPPSP